MDHPQELTPTERAALITMRLLSGQNLSNAEVATLCGYRDRTSAYYLMMRLSRVMPLVFACGVWRIAHQQVRYIKDYDGC